MREITIRRPDDFHVHLRMGDLLRLVASYTARHFGRALIMPNTDPPILTAQDACDYERQIREAVKGETLNFKPLMTIKITQATKPGWIAEAQQAGVIAGKAYPVGVTTNSADGVTDFSKLYPVFEAMREANMVLCLHGERPGEFCLDRESSFLVTVRWLFEQFPGLNIVLEHITTANAVEFIEKAPDTVAATMTAHHLCLTLDDVIGTRLRPHNFCMPVAKTLGDLEALWRATTSGNHKFFFGSDSAPHPVQNKECAEGAAGVFTAPIALPLLAQMFAERKALDRLNNFVSVHGALFYGLELNEGRLTLAEKPMTVPRMISNVVPFMAGQALQWSVKE